MKVVPLSGPSPVVKQATSQYSSPESKAARQRAIDVMTKGSSQVAKTTEQKAPQAEAQQEEPAPAEAQAIESSEQKDNNEEATASPATSAEEASQAASSSTDEAKAAEDTELKPSTEPAKEDPLSTKYAILARKEKALRAKQQQLESGIRAKEEALKQREDQFKAKEAEYQANYISKDKFSGDRLWSTLSELGISYDQITELALNQPKQDPMTLRMIDQLKAEIESLKGEQSNVKKSYEEQSKSQYQQAVQQITQDVKSLVASDPSFETIKETQSYKDVVDLIEDTFNNGGLVINGEELPKGTLLSIEQAAGIVEEHLANELTSYYSKIKKLQQKVAPQTAKKESLKPLEQPKQQQMKTLTNAVGASRPLTARDRAILAFKGQLK